MKKKRKETAIASLNLIKKGGEENKTIKETLGKISNLNVNRGNCKGFVFEHMHANELNKKLAGTKFKANVVDNNSSVDIVVKNIKTGKVKEKLQAKCGYENTKFNPTKYLEENQKLVINGDANKLANFLDKKNIKYTKSNITDKEVTRISNAMRKEGEIFNKKNAPLVSKYVETKHVLKNSHNIGVKAAKKSAIFGAGVSIGSNIVDVVNGKKDINEAATDVMVDTVVSGATGYVAGAIGSAVASTSVGSAAIGAISTGATALASTGVGSAVVGAIGTASAGITAGTTAVTGAIAAGASSVGSALGATAIGSLASAAASTTAGAAVVAGASAVTAAAVAAAPVVVTGAIIGGVCSFISSLWD